MYYNILEKDMTNFENVRKILLDAAYNKGMWECVRPTQIFYLDIVQERLYHYNEIIKECYKIINDLKELDMIQLGLLDLRKNK